MLGIYFSGTGNSRYALETFLRPYNSSAKTVSIEDKSGAKLIEQHQDFIFSYPVQYSNIPKMLRDFIDQNSRLWKKNLCNCNNGIIQRRWRRDSWPPSPALWGTHYRGAPSKNAGQHL